MAEATLARVGLRGLVPSGVGPRPLVALERALGDPFAGALASAFEALEDVDPGAVWVLRRLAVHLAVPAGEPDAARQSARVAAGIARAVALVVASGPSSEAVRFTSRAEYVASYVRARLAGQGAGWVFDRFAAIAALPVADAVGAASRIAGVPAVEVVGELVGRGGWGRLVALATQAEAERLAGVLAREAAGVTPGPDAVALVAAEAADRRAALVAAGGPGRLSPGRARLELLGAVGARTAVSAELIAAVWRFAPDASLPAPTGRTASGPRRTSPEAAARTRPDAAETPPATRAAPGTLAFAAAGCPAFLLLPDLAGLLGAHPDLLAATPAAGAIRAAVLAAAFGGRLDPDDRAVALASGLEGAAEPADVDRLLAGPVADWAARLAADPVLGWQHERDAEWVADAAARHPALGIAGVALLRAFARHLPGFGHAAAAHLIPQVLPLGGTAHVGDGLIDVVVPAGPLHVLLALAGLDAVACRVPWLDARVVLTHEVLR